MHIPPEWSDLQGWVFAAGLLLVVAGAVLERLGPAMRWLAAIAGVALVAVSGFAIVT